MDDVFGLVRLRSMWRVTDPAEGIEDDTELEVERALGPWFFEDRIPCEGERDERGLGRAGFRGESYEAVVRRAYRTLSLLNEKRRQRRKDDLFRRRPRMLTALLVGEFHGWVHTSKDARTEEWPRSLPEFCAVWGVTHTQLQNALHWTRYRKWEHKYVHVQTKETRRAVLQQRVMGTIEELERYPATERPPNMYRVASELNGDLRTGKGTVVNIGNRTTMVNVGLPPEEFENRLARLTAEALRLQAREENHAREIEAVEVPGEPEAVPQRPDSQGTEADPAGLPGGIETA